MRDSHRINLHIYVTQGDIEKSVEIESLHAGEGSSSESSVRDPEKGFASREGSTEYATLEPRRGRPDIASHIADCITHCDQTDRIGVGACGPAKMLDLTRKALSRSTYDNGPSIDLHTEVSRKWTQIHT